MHTQFYAIQIPKHRNLTTRDDELELLELSICAQIFNEINISICQQLFHTNYQENGSFIILIYVMVLMLPHTNIHSINIL